MKLPIFPLLQSIMPKAPKITSGQSWRRDHPHWMKRFRGYTPHQSTRECSRREGLQLPQVKITPRREGDFTGKAWRRLNA